MVLVTVSTNLRATGDDGWNDIFPSAQRHGAATDRWAVLAAFSGETVRRVVHNDGTVLRKRSAPARRGDAAARRPYLRKGVKPPG